MTFWDFLARLGRTIRTAVVAMAGPRLQLWTLILGSPVVTYLILRWVKDAQSPLWPVDLRNQQLGILGNAIYLGFGLLYVFILAITAGLIKGLKLTAPGGFSAEVDTADRPMPIEATLKGTIGGLHETDGSISGAGDLRSLGAGGAGGDHHSDDDAEGQGRDGDNRQG